MSIGKVLGGTVIATPAVGGGGYVIYKEVTKEEVRTDSATEPTEETANNATDKGAAVPGSPSANDLGKTNPSTTVAPIPPERGQDEAALPRVDATSSVTEGPTVSQQEPSTNSGLGKDAQTGSGTSGDGGSAES